MNKSWMWKQRSYREQFHGDEGNGAIGGAGESQANDGAASTDDKQDDAEQPDGETPPASGDQAANEGDEDGVSISFGDDTPPAEAEQEQASAPAWVKELRKQARETAKENRELKAKLAEKAQPQAEDLGKEPELDDPEIDYDTAKFKAEWQKWNARKQAHDARQAEEQAAAEAQKTAWTAKVDTYGKAKAALKVEDFDDAEEAANTAFGPTKVAILLTGAEKPAELVYALGKNPAKLKELSSIKDPIQFAFALAKLETQLKVTPRKAPPPAEKQIKGNSTAVGVADKTLERLEAEADRTGDRSKVVAYKRQLKASGA
jgi:hypothetical protein